MEAKVFISHEPTTGAYPEPVESNEYPVYLTAILILSSQYC
jgi:hypothetical protein